MSNKKELDMDAYRQANYKSKAAFAKDFGFRPQNYNRYLGTGAYVVIGDELFVKTGYKKGNGDAD